jgi:molybdopterin-binding protein
VSVDTVRRLADSGRLATRRSEDGHREVDGEDLARYLAEQEVPGAARPIVGESARNRFTGIVTKVVANDVVATVELRAGRHRIVSLMTAEAVADLGLRPGVLAVAAVKSTNVVVEVPAR